MQNNYQKTVVIPAQQAAEQARLEAEQAAQAVAEAYVTVQPAYVAPEPSYDGLTGSRGYAMPYGNCVEEPGVNNPFDGTNPINWQVTSSTPWIGASALFTYNHVGVVAGIWSNGDIELRHRNFSGGQTRFPRSQFRGYR